MKILKFLIPKDLKQKFEIKNIQLTEFIERIQGHVDQNKKGILSNSKSEFYGTVTQHSFKLQTNKIIKSQDFIIYGEFHENNDNLILEIEYSRSLFEKVAPIMIILLTTVFAVKLLDENKLEFGFIVFILIFLFVFIVISQISKTDELEKIKRKLLGLFMDKKIFIIKAS